MGKQGCVHWWQLEEANGPESVGICKYCAASRVFKNSPMWSMDFLTATEQVALARVGGYGSW